MHAILSPYSMECVFQHAIAYIGWPSPLHLSDDSHSVQPWNVTTTVDQSKLPDMKMAPDECSLVPTSVDQSPKALSELQPSEWVQNKTKGSYFAFLNSAFSYRVSQSHPYPLQCVYLNCTRRCHCQGCEREENWKAYWGVGLGGGACPPPIMRRSGSATPWSLFFNILNIKLSFWGTSH